MTLQTIERKSGPADQPADAAIIWMHGLGADANDFVPLVPELDLRRSDGSPLSIRFVFPNAPVIPVTINSGMSMRAWYDILHLDLGGVGTSGVPREDEVGLRASQRMVDDLIDEEVARGVPASRILLAGFSQGAAMTLMTGLRQSTRLAGLIALSGYLPLSQLLVSERNSGNHDVPIFMAHGSYDPVVRIQRALQTRDLLIQLGYQVDWHTYPMQHSLCGEEVVAIGAFIRRVLEPD
jgi:phospholipase/carboxylesterase